VYTTISKKVAEGFVACCMHSKTKMYCGSWSYVTNVSTELKIFLKFLLHRLFADCIHRPVARGNKKFRNLFWNSCIHTKAWLLFKMAASQLNHVTSLWHFSFQSAEFLVSFTELCQRSWIFQGLYICKWYWLLELFFEYYYPRMPSARS
jgi:hypothetical protein